MTTMIYLKRSAKERKEKIEQVIRCENMPACRNSGFDNGQKHIRIIKYA